MKINNSYIWSASGYAIKIFGEGTANVSMAIYVVILGVETMISQKYILPRTPARYDTIGFRQKADAYGTISLIYNGVERCRVTHTTYKNNVGWFVIGADSYSAYPSINNAAYKNLKCGGTITEINRWQSSMDDTGIGNVIWGSPGNAQISDNVRSTASLGEGEQSHYLAVYNHGLTAYPMGTDFMGFEAYVEGYASLASTITIAAARLYSALPPPTYTAGNATPLGITSDSDTVCPASGGSTNDWGYNFGYNNVNDSLFGVGISALSNDVATAYIDNIRLKIYAQLPFPTSQRPPQLKLKPRLFKPPSESHGQRWINKR
jgi:hypothetical protein